MSNARSYKAEAWTTDGQYFISQINFGKGGYLVTREYAWADVKHWQANEKVKTIRVSKHGKPVWDWTR